MKFFSFNYKTIIINLFFKTFFLKLCLYDEFEYIYIYIYIYGATYITRGKLALLVSST